MRPDTEIQRDVIDELDWDPAVDAADVGVTVHEGVVTLTGQVPSFSGKRTAERAVERVKGVRAVAEELEVKLPSRVRHPDSRLAGVVADALEWSTSVPHEKVKVVVEDGWVTLEGKVPWRFQRDAAERAVRGITGVRGLSNLITVTPQARSQDVRTKIEAAFRRSAEIDAQGIGVEVHDGKVTLKGRVANWPEKKAAERAAWSAMGVTQVDNRLEVGILAGARR